MPRAIPILALVALLLGGAYYFGTKGLEPAPSATRTSVRSNAPADASANTTAEPRLPTPEGTVSSIPIDEFLGETSDESDLPTAARSIALPDGSRVPVINGAFGAPDMDGAWPDDRPWSPIVRVETDSFGDQWYVHADESRSQTVLREVRRNGESVIQPLTLVYTPIEGEVPGPATDGR